MSIDTSATLRTRGLAWKATDRPAACIIGMSLEPSPTAIVRAGSRPSSEATSSSVARLTAPSQTSPQAWGDVCDGAVKRATLLDVASLLGLDPARTIAVGDGSNDIPMMQAAGLSVAFHAKPRVRKVAEVSIDTGGLERLLDVLG